MGLRKSCNIMLGIEKGGKPNEKHLLAWGGFFGRDRARTETIVRNSEKTKEKSTRTKNNEARNRRGIKGGVKPRGGRTRGSIPSKTQ